MLLYVFMHAKKSEMNDNDATRDRKEELEILVIIKY